MHLVYCLLSLTLPMPSLITKSDGKSLTLKEGRRVKVPAALIAYACPFERHLKVCP